MSVKSPASVSSCRFPSTRWSVVLEATQPNSSKSDDALEFICRAYWHPLYAYVRRCGRSPQDAEDLTQEFFRRLLEKRWLDAVVQGKGRLRTFLIAALKNFMSNEWRRISTRRRGGGQIRVPFDAALAESRFTANANALTPQDAFDQQWAQTLLHFTVDRLRAEFDAAGKLNDFDVLKNSLLAGRGAIDYAELAKQLDENEGTVRVTVHRMRKRFRELYRAEISQTLANGEDLDAEVRYLAAALARQ